VIAVGAVGIGTAVSRTTVMEDILRKTAATLAVMVVAAVHVGGPHHED